MISDGTAQFKVVDQKEDGTDIDALKSELEAVKSSLAAVQTAISDAQNFTIIYPNGGTAEKPASITANKRYVEDNPFPGYYVLPILQFKVESNWGNYDSNIYESMSCGAKCGYMETTDKIIIQTGESYVMTWQINDLNIFGKGNTNYPSLPCRVLVYKLAKK